MQCFVVFPKGIGCKYYSKIVLELALYEIMRRICFNNDKVLQLSPTLVVTSVAYGSSSMGSSMVSGREVQWVEEGWLNGCFNCLVEGSSVV